MAQGTPMMEQAPPARGIDDNGGNPISPKVTASALGGAIATILWIIVDHFLKNEFSSTEVSALTGATSTIFGFIFGYLVVDPRRS